MCIPCVMCGACMDAAAGGARDGRCPACGAELPPGAVSCPACFTFVMAPRPGGPGAAASAGEGPTQSGPAR